MERFVVEEPQVLIDVVGRCKRNDCEYVNLSQDSHKHKKEKVHVQYGVVKGVEPAVKTTTTAAPARPIARDLPSAFHQNIFRKSFTINFLVIVPECKQEEHLPTSKNSNRERDSDVSNVVGVVFEIERNFQSDLHQHAGHDYEPERKYTYPLRMVRVIRGRYCR